MGCVEMKKKNEKMKSNGNILILLYYIILPLTWLHGYMGGIGIL